MFRKEAALCQLWVGCIRSPTALENHTSDLQNPKMRIAAFSSYEAESLMRGLATRYGGDRAVTDVSRVLRLPSFKHRGKNTWITMSSTSAKLSSKQDWPDALFQSL